VYLKDHDNAFGWSMFSLLSAIGFYTLPPMLYPFVVLLGRMAMAALAKDARVSGAILFRRITRCGLVTAILTLALYSRTLIFLLPVYVMSGFAGAVWLARQVHRLLRRSGSVAASPAGRPDWRYGLATAAVVVYLGHALLQSQILSATGTKPSTPRNSGMRNRAARFSKANCSRAIACSAASVRRAPLAADHGRCSFTITIKREARRMSV
jgi:hypothetical protein